MNGELFMIMSMQYFSAVHKYIPAYKAGININLFKHLGQK